MLTNDDLVNRIKSANYSRSNDEETTQRIIAHVLACKTCRKIAEHSTPVAGLAQ